MNLPNHHTKDELETAIKIVITAWNAVVLDAWNNENHYESELVKTLDEMPKEMKIIIKRLIKRKKTMFASDPRAVGNYWVRENDGGFIFGCEARLDVENAPTTEVAH
ncbi:MAG: hypothetical protein M3A44_14635 [Gammaproteobacteria bacterium]